MRLKELRIERNLTQCEVAEGIQTGQSNIGRWERGEVLPTSDFVVKLADFFNVSADFLLNRTDDLGAIMVPGTASALSNDERELLSLYQDLRDDMKQAFMASLRAMVKVSAEQGAVKKKA